MSVLEGWQTRKIRDLFASSSPGDWGSEGTPEDGVPVLRSTNFRNDGSIDFSDLAFRKIDKSRLEKRRVKYGCILIEKSGGSPTQAAGRVVYCDRDFNGTASNFIEVITVKNDLSPKYIAFLLYYLYQTGLVLKYQQQTTGIINFKLGKYAEEYVSLPIAKPEQTEIAEILSALDRAIEQTEALIAKQQRIKTGLMQDLLTKGVDQHGNIRSEATHAFKDSPLGRIPTDWVVSVIEDVAKITTGNKDTQDRDDSAPYPFFVRSQTIERIDSYSFDGEAILTAGDGVGVGKVFHYFAGKFDYHQRVYCIHSFSECISGYFLFQFFRQNFMSRVAQFSAKGSVDSVRREMIAKMPIPLPSIDEQQNIGNILMNAENVQAEGERTLEKLQLLKCGLMHDLLTGERRVTPLLVQAAPQ